MAMEAARYRDVQGIVIRGRKVWRGLGGRGSVRNLEKRGPDGASPSWTSPYFKADQQVSMEEIRRCWPSYRTGF